MPPVVLVDVFNLAFRSHYAHINLAHEKKPTGLSFGFLQAIYNLRKEVSNRIVFCWDHGIPSPTGVRARNWRDEVLPSYKEKKSGDDTQRVLAVSQLPGVYEMTRCLGYSSVAVLGLEADDVIGVLSREIPGEILVFSTDRDFYQLLNERVQVLVPKKDKGVFRRIQREEVEKEFGIPVNRWAEYLALGGDKSDNIKPMAGMGPKTAVKIILDGGDLRLNKTFADQIPKFRDKWSKLEPVWENIQKSYFAAQIPRSWADPRIKNCLATHGAVSYRPNQYWATVEQRRQAQEKFIQFLADRNMVTLLSVRRSFFGEVTCQTPNQNPLRPKPKLIPPRTLI